MDESALNLVEQAVGSFSDGVRIVELENHLRLAGWTLTRRSLLRYLNALISSDRIWAGGSYRAPVYYPHLKTEEDEIFLAISSTDRALRKTQAEPVPFRRDLLLSHTQRGTSLDDKTREHLHQIGTSGKPASSTGACRTPETFLIDLSWASSFLEGNSYSLLEAEKLLTFGEVVEGKEWLEAQMILNHREAVEFLTEGAEEIAYNSFSIRNLHAILSDNLLRDPEAHGRLRQVSPVDNRSSHAPLSTPQLLEEYFERTLEAAASIADPFEQSFFTLVYLIYLQPFDNLNGAVARLAANMPLLTNNLCPISFIDISMQDYAKAEREICQGNSEASMRYLFVKGYERSVARYLTARVELQEPDSFRMKYRRQLTEIIQEVILRGECGRKMIERIHGWAFRLSPGTDNDRLIKMAEAELRGLHEGNIARFRLRPAEFTAWKRKSQLPDEGGRQNRQISCGKSRKRKR